MPDFKHDFDFDAYGVNYGFGLNVGPLKLGFSGFAGKGLGSRRCRSRTTPRSS